MSDLERSYSEIACPGLTGEGLEKVANTLRFLCTDAVEAARSGHPGMPMGMAEIASLMWLKYLRYYSGDPSWLVRDRFVLSNGHGSALLYALLHLSGFDLSLDDLRSFRQLGSACPGHPESFLTPGVECCTGPLGQGIANAVGMALGQKIISARYDTDASDLFGHRVMCFVGDGCLMEGISAEASSLAGHLNLNNLFVVYDDNGITLAGRTDDTFSEDVSKRYESYGWRVLRVDAYDFCGMDELLRAPFAETAQGPVLVMAKTVIGKGSPNRADSPASHGAPLGAEELKLAKEAAGWPVDKPFYVPNEVKEIFGSRRAVLKKQYDDWKERYLKWRGGNPERAESLDFQLSLETPKDLRTKLFESASALAYPISTRRVSQELLQTASKCIPSLIGGSADLETSCLSAIKGAPDLSSSDYTGINIRFGVREHAMGAIMNGLSHYGAFLPYGSTFFCFSDYMRPAIRLAAIASLPTLSIFTHDSVFIGEDGPTHQPVEHLASFRAMPNVDVYRPAGIFETAVCYDLALRRRQGPSLLVLTRQNLPDCRELLPEGALPSEASLAEGAQRGAYTFWRSDDGAEVELLFVASGSELFSALDVALHLSGEFGCASSVVSMPCWELFMRQDRSYRRSVIPKRAKKVVIEASSPFGWSHMIESDSDMTLILGIDRFGISAPLSDQLSFFSYTKEKLAERVREQFFSQGI